MSSRITFLCLACSVSPKLSALTGNAYRTPAHYVSGLCLRLHGLHRGGGKRCRQTMAAKRRKYRGVRKHGLGRGKLREGVTPSRRGDSGRILGNVLKIFDQNPAYWFVLGKNNVFLSRIIGGQRYSLDPHLQHWGFSSSHDSASRCTRDTCVKTGLNSDVRRFPRHRRA